jgi:hypothetical protein
LKIERFDLPNWLAPHEDKTSRSESTTARASILLAPRVLIFAALALFLVWEVLTRSLVAYLADAWPEAAIHLRPSSATALVNLANAKLTLEPAAKMFEPAAVSTAKKGVQSSPQTDSIDGAPSSLPSAQPDLQIATQIHSWAETALLNDPLNARAFRILGQLSQSMLDERQTERLMRAAVRRSLHESVAVYWLMRKSYIENDLSASLRYADVLLRTRPTTEIQQAVMPMLGAIAESPRGSIELKRLLASDPPWRKPFFFYLPASVRDARTPLDVLLSLKGTPNPPTAAEIGQYLSALVNHGFYDLAYYTWLQFLPPEQLAKVGHLANGQFDDAPSGLPFDWSFSKTEGAEIQLATRSDRDGDKALLLEFGGSRVTGLNITQLIVLPPGAYQFKGAEKSNLVSGRGLHWRVSCASQKKELIGESPAINGVQPDWKNFSFSFTVPETDCPAQYVTLLLDARSASEQFVSGSAWLDDLDITQSLTATSGDGQGQSPDVPPDAQAQPSPPRSTMPAPSD